MPGRCFLFFFMLLLGCALSLPAGTFVEQGDANGCISPKANGTLGMAIVLNNCAYDIYVQSVAGIDIDPMITLSQGDKYSEDYRIGPNGAGVAIKITNDASNWSAPMLLEYTPSEALDIVFYDMSVSVGGNKQGTGGIGDVYELVPSKINASVDCVAVNYNDSYVDLGESDAATKSCPLSTSIELRLC